jgi:hypothetical protein
MTLDPAARNNINWLQIFFSMSIHTTALDVVVNAFLCHSVRTTLRGHMLTEIIQNWAVIGQYVCNGTWLNKLQETWKEGQVSKWMSSFTTHRLGCWLQELCTAQFSNPNFPHATTNSKIYNWNRYAKGQQSNKFEFYEMRTLSMSVMICRTSWSCRRSSPCL